jgi:hypothetical protein
MRAVLLALTLAARLAGPQSWALTGTASGYSYDVAGWGRVTIDGVCSVTPSAVSCWRPDGTPDATLTASVDAQIQAAGANVLRLKMGGPNLLLVSSQPPSTAEIARPISPGQAGEMLMQGLQRRGERVFLLNWLPVHEDETRTDLTMSIPIFGDAQRMRFRPGERVELGGATIVLERVRRSAVNSMMLTSAAPPPEWEVPFKIEGFQPSADIRLHPKLLGKDGKELRTETNPRPKRPPGYWGPFRYSLMESPMGLSNIGYWPLHCDPKEIGYIEFRPTYHRRVTYDGIALKPMK